MSGRRPPAGPGCRGRDAPRTAATEVTNTPARPRLTAIPWHVSCKVEGMLGRLGRRDMLALVALGPATIGIPAWLSAVAGAIGVFTAGDCVCISRVGSDRRTALAVATVARG
jgi:hypothetical protein